VKYKMLSDQISQSAIRIFDTNAKVVGCGFYFADAVLTCAHVLNQALGISSVSTKKPTEYINFDFPLLNPRTMLTGRVTTWLPVDDIASLEIVSSPPKNLLTTRLIKAANLWGHPFRTYGFPRGFDEGVWASGRILDKVSNGWLEIEDTKQTGFFVQPGFSGGAVWDEYSDGIVGMVVGSHVNLNSRVAYVIPISKLLEFLPEIAENAFDPIDDDLQNIREFISLGSYMEAYEKCSKALLGTPNHPMLNLLNVVSLLKGRGADRLHASNMLKIEKHIKTACASPKIRPTALVILGIIKYDRYIVNGLDEGKPSIDELKSDLHNSDFTQVDRNLIKSIKASDGALTYLGLQ
jgi:hypothetical protein